RLHVLRRRVDVAVQFELQRHRGCAQRARRGHLRDAGDLAELACERLGDGGRHGFRACAGQGRRNADGRKVHLRQGRHRQQSERHEPAERDCHHQQRRGDRPVTEGCGNIHGASFCATGFSGPVASTLTPARRRYWPLTTTRSPACKPPVTTLTASSLGPTEIGRFSALSSAPITQANGPWELRCTTAGGTVTTFFNVSASTRTRTNSPGQSLASSLGKDAFSLIVLVAWSI